MQLDLGTLCYYAIDPLNISASTVSAARFFSMFFRCFSQLIVQVHVRVPVTTTVPVNSALSVNVAALVNQNQSSLNTSMSFTVSNYTGYTGFTVFVSISFIGRLHQFRELCLAQWYDQSRAGKFELDETKWHSAADDLYVQIVFTQFLSRTLTALAFQYPDVQQCNHSYSFGWHSIGRHQCRIIYGWVYLGKQISVGLHEQCCRFNVSRYRLSRLGRRHEYR